VCVVCVACVTSHVYITTHMAQHWAQLSLSGALSLVDGATGVLCLSCCCCAILPPSKYQLRVPAFKYLHLDHKLGIIHIPGFCCAREGADCEVVQLLWKPVTWLLTGTAWELL
jgi:hypothetical protein